MILPGSASIDGSSSRACSSASASSAAESELRAEEHRLQRGDDRVAPEDRHEPRHPRRRQPADAVAAPHPQRREVGDRLVERVVERVAARSQLWHVQPPRGERVADVRTFVAEMLLDGRRRRLLAAQRGDDVDPQLPALPRLELDRKPDRAPVALARAGEDHLGPRVPRAVLRQHELVAVALAHICGRRQRPRLLGIAEREIVLLDRDDVREVGAHLELELERAAARSPRCGRTSWSCMPSPTKRSREIESTSWSRPRASGLRRKNAAE